MERLTLWAPYCRSVAALIGDAAHPLEPAGHGWWAADVPDTVREHGYLFSLDGAAGIPDPRSPWQPWGVHGPSHPLDHGAFLWHDDGWRAPPLSAAVIYELHVGTFTPDGTFEAAADYLDNLVDLGVTHVELMPVAEFAGDRGWGYDGVALFAPHHAYGGPAGLKYLVDACHRAGLGVILDVVYNHLGPEGAYAPRAAPYLTGHHRTNWGAAVNFDGADSDEVRRFVLDNAVMWLRDYHVDGLRLDGTHAIADQSATPILEALAERVERLAAELGRPLVLIAENDRNDPRLVRSRQAGGSGLDGVWADDLHHALHAVLTGERRGYYRDFGTLADVAKACRCALVYDGQYSAHRRRLHGRPATGLSGHRFVVCLQNHDQVGNRAAGDRIGQQAGADMQMIGAAVIFFSPFVPLLLAGEEWGASSPFQYFTSVEDERLARQIVEGRRREFAAFGWPPEEVPDPQDPATFARSKLPWAQRPEGPHGRMLDWYRRLIHLRRSAPALCDGDMSGVRTAWDEQARWLEIRRGDLVLLANLADHGLDRPLADGLDDAAILLASKDGCAIRDGAVSLPHRSAAVYGCSIRRRGRASG
ncbi:MAG: malto-oligosyltrehalose trehalohydrolase [Planctomycetes bacterium]|nr:malto-oligosyltrehalose trehalohydrolase [Planctomycetota bacterium]